MSLDSMIKGRTAECIVEELFRNYGYDVFPYGYENLLRALVTKPFKIEKSFEHKMYIDGSHAYRMLQHVDVYDRIRRMPDFLVIRRNPKLPNQTKAHNQCFLIDVKFRRSGQLNISEEDEYNLEGVHIILVTGQKPYFFTHMISRKDIRVDIKRELEKEIPEALHVVPLTESECFPYFKNIHKRYEDAVKRYLLNEHIKTGYQ